MSTYDARKLLPHVLICNIYYMHIYAQSWDPHTALHAFNRALIDAYNLL